MGKHYQIHRKTALKIYFRFYLPIMVLHPIHVHKSVFIKISQQKLLEALHIIIYRKLRQPWIFVDEI
jgi:hypothetical protein